MLQLPFQPAYALTIHKVQALTIKHFVDGCLEGIFAHGQIYVLISRVTQPHLFRAVGLPPSDLLEDVAKAWHAAGIDVNQALEGAAAISDEWSYTPALSSADPCKNIRSRLQPKYEEKRRVPLKLKSLAEILNPQLKTATVLHALLLWIDRADLASQSGEPKPPLERENEEPLFPDGQWWLTELEQRRGANEADLASDAEIDPEHLTSKPDEAAVLDSDSSTGTDGDSDASLPAGPTPMHMKRQATSSATVNPDFQRSTRDQSTTIGRRLTKKNRKEPPEHAHKPNDKPSESIAHPDGHSNCCVIARCP